MPTITPTLWFETQAEDAARFYTAIFPDSAIGAISRYSDAGPGPAGSVLTVEFTLDGRPFVALNGGPDFPFTEAISFAIDCADQAEVDYYWQALLADGGQEVQCGWLRDQFGLSWQVVPTRLWQLLNTGDEAQHQRVTAAMLQMVKLDIAGLEAAAEATLSG